MLLDILTKPKIMGILNVTPDSFSDAGLYLSIEAAVVRAHRMIDQGADIIDIGGESTRPGASSVTVDEELMRVMPVLERLRAETDIPISVDTSSPEVMRQAASLGANLINDVRALQYEGALAAAAKTGLTVCLMHMQGRPSDMQDQPTYEDLMTDIMVFFKQRIEICRAAGMKANQIWLDPGFGFGKSVQNNLTLINRLSEFKTLGCPLMVGLSRKSTIAKVTAPMGGATLTASVVGALLAVQNGASMVRVHDVKETAEAFAIFDAIRTEGVAT